MRMRLRRGCVNSDCQFRSRGGKILDNFSLHGTLLKLISGLWSYSELKSFYNGAHWISLSTWSTSEPVLRLLNDPPFSRNFRHQSNSNEFSSSLIHFNPRERNSRPKSRGLSVASSLTFWPQFLINDASTCKFCH